MNLFHFLLTFAICYSQSSALDNGLALTPPMGFLSWLKYECNTDCTKNPNNCISEELFKNIANLMVSEGYKDVGYEYVIIDDCWLAKNRTEDGTLQPDPSRFPSGMKALGDYIRNRGLKFGLYEDYGSKTCAGYPGILGHLETDAETFAEWGVDYTKIDGCNSDMRTRPQGYVEFGNDLNKTGRPIVYSCSWPAYEETDHIHSNYSLLAETCNLWRNWYDISDSWSSVINTLDFYGNNQDRFAQFAGPGHWNDPDMLLIGNSGVNLNQSRAQMAAWSVLAAPLLISTDLASISAENKAILQNKAVIAINQDSLGKQALRVKQENGTDFWVKELAKNSEGNSPYAIAVINRNNTETHVKIELSDLGLGNGKYFLEDLFDIHQIKYWDENPTTTLDANVNATGVVLVRAEPAP